MQQINSSAQYKELTSEAKKKGYTLSNCFFLPGMIQEKCEKGNLYARWIPNGLLILEDAGNFYRCYYYFSKDADTEPVTLSKKAVIELPFATTLSEAQLLQEDRIRSMGFYLGRESALMMALPEDIPVCFKAPPKIPVEYAKVEDAEKCLELICAVFDELYAFIPNIEEMKQAILEQQVTVIRDDAEPVAVFHCGWQKQFIVLHHLAVASSHRRKGLGNALLTNHHHAYMDKVKGFQHWVDIYNEPAVKMYQAQGYRFSTRRANEYIKL